MLDYEHAARDQEGNFLYAPPDKELIEALVRLVEATKGTSAEDAVADFVQYVARPPVLAK